MRSTWQCLLWCWCLDTYSWQKELLILAVAVRWNVSSVSFAACHWRYFCCFWLWCPLSHPVDCLGWRDFDWVQVKPDLKHENSKMTDRPSDLQFFFIALLENPCKNGKTLGESLQENHDKWKNWGSWPWEEALNDSWAYKYFISECN